MTPVEAAVERALDAWRAARERQALIEGRWGLPPRVPVETGLRAVFDPTGRWALLVGYRAVHLLDLRAATTRMLLRDARADRAAAFAPDGQSAVVLDGHGGLLHRVTPGDAPRVETHRWRCPHRLRGEMAAAVDADGRVAAVGTDLDEAPLEAVWLDGATGAVLETLEVPAERLGTTGAVAGVRATATGLHIWLDDPAAPAIEVDRGADALRRPTAALGPRDPWRLVKAGRTWRLEGPGGPIEIARPEATPTIADDPDRGRLAVAVDGRVRVYDTATGARVGGRVGPPGRERFASVAAMHLDGDRLWVHGAAPTDPFGADAGSVVAAFTLAGSTWRPLGVVALAGRAMAPKPDRPHGERMSNVYVKGVQLSVAQLEAQGITFVGGGDARGEEARDRFACPRDDPYDREVPFARTPLGFFGRLDTDRGLGAEAAAPFERPAVARALLRGETPAWDAATAAALDDWAARLAWWRGRGDAADALGQLMEASAGLGDLLPEIVHRAPPGKGGRPPKASALRRVAERMQRRASTEREETVFREMLARERRALLPAMRRARLAGTCPGLDDAALDRATEALGPAVEAVADVAEAGARTLALHDVADGGALAALLAAVGADLGLDGLDLSGCGLDDDALAALVATPWPTLRHLDLSRTAITDAGAATLAAATGLAALEGVATEATAVTLRGRARLEWSPTLPALRPTLSPLAAWAGLLGAREEAPPTPALEALWSATAVDVELRDPDALPGACLRWRDAGSPALELDGVPASPAGVRALAAAGRARGLGRLTLRRCALHDALAEPLVELASTLPPEATLDLSHNPLSQVLALRFALGGDGDGDHAGCAVDLTGNPLEAAGWGLLRGVLGPRLRGAPDDPADQLAAAVTLGRLPVTWRARMLGRALAAAPEHVEPTLAALDDRLGPDPRRALLTDPDFGPTLPRAGWPAVVARVLALAGDQPAEWTLGPVRCRLDGGALSLRPDPPLTAVTLEAEPDDSRLRKLLSGQDVLTGDPDFDRVALIAGDPAVALAVLDGPTRAAVAAWLPRGLTLREGVVAAPGVSDPAAIAELAALAGRLVRPPEPLVGALVDRLVHESTPDAATRLAEAIVAADPSPGQLDAAADTAIEAARRIIADALVPALDAERVTRLSPAGLAAALERAPGALRLPLIERLAEVGDERAVAPLTGLARAFFEGGAVKKAAKAAIEAIVRRQGGLRAGGLTVVAGDERGGLSVTKPDER